MTVLNTSVPEAGGVRSRRLPPPSIRSRSGVREEFDPMETPEDWRNALEVAILRDPLLDVGTSLAALGAWHGVRPPRAVLQGIGLATPHALSAAFPLDGLGYLLAAESVRRAVGAPRLIVFLADAHPVACGFPAGAVRERADATERLLRRIGDICQLTALEVHRASEVHGLAPYRAILRAVEHAAGPGANPYATREVADIEYWHRACDGVMKLGWTYGSAAPSLRDETWFDRAFRAWLGDHVGFLYAKAGRRSTSPARGPAPTSRRNRAVASASTPPRTWRPSSALPWPRPRHRPPSGSAGG